MNLTKIQTVLILSSIIFATVLNILVGCAHLDPNANALVVRAEQVESVALSTFDLILNVDNSNREFFKTNAPGFHVFAEYLRAPVMDTGASLMVKPRAIQMIRSLQELKTAYKSSKANSGELQRAVSELQSSVDQAAAWLSTVNTNKTN